MFGSLGPQENAGGLATGYQFGCIDKDCQVTAFKISIKLNYLCVKHNQNLLQFYYFIFRIDTEIKFLITCFWFENLVVSNWRKDTNPQQTHINFSFEVINFEID